MRGWLAKQGFRIVGPPPPAAAPKVVRLRYIRRFYTRLLPLYLLAWVVAAISGLPLWAWVVIGVGAAVWLQGLTSLSLRIRAEERASSNSDDV